MKLAATVPSITWWSTVRLRVIISRTAICPSLTTGFSTDRPAPSIAVCPAFSMGREAVDAAEHADREGASGRIVGGEVPLSRGVREALRLQGDLGYAHGASVLDDRHNEAVVQRHRKADIGHVEV